MSEIVKIQNGVVVISGAGGHTVISRESLLKRLHYFDGKFLRATDLNLEQQALLNQVRLSNQATGFGVVHGYSCTLAGGDRLDVGPGLAIDPGGRILHLPEEIHIGIAELIEKSRKSLMVSDPVKAKERAVFGACELATTVEPDTVLESVRLYLITVGHAEAYCGEEDVYGKLCEEACITSTERPYVIEGVVIRALPLNLPSELATSRLNTLSSRHLRSQVAASYFAAEQKNPAPLISGDGLSSSIWCLGAEAMGGSTVPIAVLARAGSQTVFLDAWIARREKMETPAKRYWAGRMAMRPWNVFLAQVLQFQCQLASCFTTGKTQLGEDPCAEEKKVAAEAAVTLGELMEKFKAIASSFATVEGVTEPKHMLEVAPINQLWERLSVISKQIVSQQYLIDCGIIELPSAGYLPVDPKVNLTVNKQIRRLTGEGLDLRFCVVRPDYIPHALEEAQHMERISLLEGIDDPAAKPKVDVFVPDGRIEEYKEKAPGTGYEMDLVLSLPGAAILRAGLAASTEKVTELTKTAIGLQQSALVEAVRGSGLQAVLRGAARGEELTSGGSAFYYAAQTPETTGIGKLSIPSSVLDLIRSVVADSSKTAVEAKKTAAASTLKENIATGTSRSLPSNRLQRLSSGLRFNTQVSQEPSQAIWLSLRTNEDPFALPRGSATQVSAQAVFLYSQPLRDSLVLVVEDLSVAGQLRIDDIVQRSSDTRLTCRLKADGILNYVTEQSGKSSEGVYPLKLDEKVYVLRNTEVGPRPSYRVSVINPSLLAELGNTELRFERLWTDSSTATIKAVFRPLSTENINQLKKIAIAKKVSLVESLSLTGEVSAALAKNEVLIFSGEQKISNDVLKPGNALHSASLSALARLGAAKDDSSFADFAARQLFPPPQAVPDELKVFARHDWVLFHRRRDKACGLETSPEALVQPRRFRIFHASVANEEERILLRNALLQNRPEIISRFRPQPVTIVEFEAGIQTVRTSHDDVRADWQTRVYDDADIALGVVATRGSAYDESQTLAEARLNSLIDPLAPVTELADDAELLWAEQIPDNLASGEVDGIIVYATLQVATVCHEIFRLELDPEQIETFIQELKSSKSYRASILEVDGVQLGCVPKFRNGETRLFGGTAANDLVKAWGDAGNRQPVRVVSLLPLDDGGKLPADQPYMEQSKVIADTVGDGAVPTDPIGLLQPFLTCPAVTLLIVEPQAPPTVNDVYGYVPPVAEQIEPKDFKLLLEKEGLPKYFPASNPDKGEFWYPLGSVPFDADNRGDLVALDAVMRKAIANELLSTAGNPHLNLIYSVFSLSKQGANTDQVSRDKAEAKQIAKAMNLFGSITHAIYGQDFWPTNGEAMTLVLIPNRSYFTIETTHKVLYAKAMDPSSIDKDIVTSSTKALNYDKEGELIKDLAFEAFVARMKKEGTQIKTIEVVSTEIPSAGTKDPQAEKALTALKEAGVATADAKVVLRVAEATEKELLTALGNEIKTGLILRKKIDS